MPDLRKVALERMTEAFGLDRGMQVAAQAALAEMPDAEVSDQITELEELKVEAQRLYRRAVRRRNLAEIEQAQVEPVQVEPERGWVPLWQRLRQAVPTIAASPMFGSRAEFGFDIGTANTRIYAKGHDVVLNEPSIVAVRTSDQADIIAVGSAARDLAGQDGVRLVRPLRDGVIVHADLASGMIRGFFDKVQRPQGWFPRPQGWARPIAVIAMGTVPTSADRAVVRNAATQAGFGEMLWMDEPYAAALGAGVSDRRAAMVVDIGGAATDMTVMADGKPLNPAKLWVGGDRMTEAIVGEVRRRYNMRIGEAAAEELKIKYGAARGPRPAQGPVRIRGRDLIGHEMGEVVVSSADISDMLKGPIREICNGVQSIIETASDRVKHDIETNGVVLTGGGANLYDIDKYLKDALGVPVSVHADPQLCVARGIGVTLDDPSLLRRLRS